MFELPLYESDPNGIRLQDKQLVMSARPGVWVASAGPKPETAYLTTRLGHHFIALSLSELVKRLSEPPGVDEPPPNVP